MPRSLLKSVSQFCSAFVQNSGHFHDLAGRGTSGKKRDCPAKSEYAIIKDDNNAWLKIAQVHVDV